MTFDSLGLAGIGVAASPLYTTFSTLGSGKLEGLVSGSAVSAFWDGVGSSVRNSSRLLCGTMGFNILRNCLI